MAPCAEILNSALPDPEYEELIKALGPQTLPTDLDIPTLRHVTNGRKAKAREALGGPPPGLVEGDIEISVRDGSKILAYVYAPSDRKETTLPIMIFFHGGGFCIGSRHDDMDSNRSIAIQAGIVVVSIEYRLAPEHPFPQAVHDGLDALNWIAKNASIIRPNASASAGLIVNGTSAGGNIANAVVYLNREQEVPVRITGQLLSVAPLIPLPFIPDKYKDEYVSHVQNKAVTIPPPELSRLFLGGRAAT
ncbi:unnamed protein product [Clonostachys rosea]|uniref:Alpha/beta hydrolase fold-3 domain-containing protein n=1 Tax=Bionectria ochroleuca TaxID=29856 RepID=A0ABY6UJU4_BIOOC|nr:unnamed protein product [Clonostachys rosea]